MNRRITEPARASGRRANAGLAAFIGLLLLGAVANTGALAEQRGRASTGQLHHLRHDGRDRTYLVHDYSRGRPAPVIIVLHGGGGNAENAVQMTGMNQIAAREGLIAVYPNGTAERKGVRLLTWNAGHCCAAAMRSRVDDVGFIAAVIDRLVKDGRADASRIYVTGMSNGAMLTHRIGRELSTRIAAIAPVVGAIFGDERPPAAPVPAIVIVGADDEIVPGGGGSLQLRGVLGGRSAADRPVAPALDQATYWARANGCGEPVRRREKASTVTEWTSCSSGAPVVFHRVGNNGHAWPGGQPGRQGANRPTRAFDASEEIWRFFRSQRR